MTDPAPPSRFLAPPLTQKNYALALSQAFASLRNQSGEQLTWLGAAGTGKLWQLRVLDEVFLIDLAAENLSTPGGAVRPNWSILALHYLCVRARPEEQPPEITFADLPLARAYTGVYHARVVRRFCATAGRGREQFDSAARALAGKQVDGGDLAFDFQVFPRIVLRLIWHAADEEFPPTATLLLPPNITLYFCEEDIVVLSENLISRLCGGRF